MYRINEGTIDLPGDWHDRTINVVSSNLSGPGTTLTITRDDIPWGMGFTEYVADQGRQAAQALKNFELLDQYEMEVAGLPAVEIECRWVAAQGKVHQLITTVKFHGGQKVLVLTASVAGQMSENQKIELRRLASTLRFDPQRS